MTNLSTIQYGIDLGTTNSALAIFMNQKVRIVTNKAQHKTTPSAVFIRGKVNEIMDICVGEDARDALMHSPENVFQEFKKQIGKQPKKIYTPASMPNLRLTAVDLSSYILKDIRNSTRLHGDLPPAQAILVTVPAAFEDPQKDETKIAAITAGFKHVELLPEPEAAAIAYGRNAETSHNPIWLAYDLGGGTFDAALVRGEDGLFSVLDHLGDRNIGGSDLDIAIMNELVIPKIPELASKNFEVVDSPPWWMLKILVEKAKISLSLEETASIHFDSVEKQFGEIEPIYLHRSDIEALQVKIFGPTLDICKRLLANNNLKPEHVEKVILIGGPTQSQFLRTMIKHGAIDPKNQVRYEGLDIQTDSSVDPMTAVAEGAAIIAAGRRFEIEEEADKTNDVNLTVIAPARTLEDEVLIAGELTGADIYIGWTVKFVREQAGPVSGWKSAPFQVSKVGKFAGQVSLAQGLNYFVVSVFNDLGDLLINSRFEVLQDVGICERKLERGIGVADNEGNTIWLFKKGHPIPESSDKSEVMIELLTTEKISQGSSGEALRVPVVVGDYLKAALNRQVGIMTVSGIDVPANVPAGSLVRIEASLDVSGQHIAQAFLEDFDDIELTYNKIGGITVDHEEVKSCLEEIRKNLKLFKTVRNEDDNINSIVDEFEKRKLIELLEEKFTTKNWDKAMTDAQHLSAMLDPHLERVDILLAWKNHRERCDKNLQIAKNIIDENQSTLSDDWLSRWNALLVRYDNAKEERDVVELERLAFTEMPELFESNEILSSRVSVATDSGVKSLQTTQLQRKGDVRNN